MAWHKLKITAYFLYVVIHPSRCQAFRSMSGHSDEIAYMRLMVAVASGIHTFWEENNIVSHRS